MRDTPLNLKSKKKIKTTKIIYSTNSANPIKPLQGICLKILTLNVSA
jgi:hypothetical protein